MFSLFSTPGIVTYHLKRRFAVTESQIRVGACWDGSGRSYWRELPFFRLGVLRRENLEGGLQNSSDF